MHLKLGEEPCTQVELQESTVQTLLSLQSGIIVSLQSDARFPFAHAPDCPIDLQMVSWQEEREQVE
jgi:hypothetical protein